MAGRSWLQTRPVPNFAGIARLGVTFISEVFNVKSRKITMRVGKSKETVGRNRTNAPNIEVLVARWPNAPWLPTPNSIEDDVNPVMVSRKNVDPASSAVIRERRRSGASLAR
jgi:hypothetical protein